MKKKILRSIFTLFIVFLVALLGINISFLAFKKDLKQKNYDRASKSIYVITSDGDDEYFANKYKKQMYVSKENSDWLISDYEDGVSINKYLGNDKDVVIPEKLDGKTVLRLDFNFIEQPDDYIYNDGDSILYHDHCAFDNTNIESISIPSGVKEIRKRTFTGIYGQSAPTLKKITVSNDNEYFYVDKSGEICIKESNSVIYGYKIERNKYYYFDRFPFWMQYVIITNYLSDYAARDIDAFF